MQLHHRIQCAAESREVVSEAWLRPAQRGSAGDALGQFAVCLEQARLWCGPARGQRVSSTPEVPGSRGVYARAEGHAVVLAAGPGPGMGPLSLEGMVLGRVRQVRPGARATGPVLALFLGVLRDPLGEPRGSAE